MGVSRLKPRTTKEIDSLTKVRPRSIKHLSLVGVPVPC